MEILTKSAKETEEFGREFANKLRGAGILALVGGLGGGKTTFVQGLAAGLGIKERVISPTFILRRDYEGERGRLVHLDLYRLEEEIENEFRKLGTQEDLAKGAIVVIEWADRVRDLLPPSTVWIRFEDLGGDVRKITVG